MPLDRREAVLAAAFDIVASLAANAVRNPDRPGVPETLPALVFWDGGHRRADVETGGDQYIAAVEIELYVGAASAAALGPALNALWATVVAAFAADVTLGGLADDVRHVDMSEPEINTEEGTLPYAAAAIGFEVFFETAPGDPYNPPG